MSLAGRLAASTREWLRMIAEFDARKGWARWGIQSCAHWLAWACSVGPGAAREYVRVATGVGVGAGAGRGVRGGAVVVFEDAGVDEGRGAGR